MITDKTYLKNTLENLRMQKSLHDDNFLSNPAHENCLPRYDRAIENLEKELEKLEAISTPASGYDNAPPQQVGDGMLYNDVEEEIYQVAEGDPDASLAKTGWTLERKEEK
jgi:hypothetical protein